MKRTIAALLLVILLVLALSASFGWSRQRVQSVSGSITLDGKPLTNVCLQFWDDQVREPYGYVFTDSMGNFLMEPNHAWIVFRPGVYRIRLLDMEAFKNLKSDGTPTIRFPVEYAGKHTTPLRVEIRDQHVGIPPLDIRSSDQEDRDASS